MLVEYVYWLWLAELFGHDLFKAEWLAALFLSHPPYPLSRSLALPLSISLYLSFCSLSLHNMECNL